MKSAIVSCSFKAGTTIENYKEMGRPEQFAERFRLDELQGSHALGHTRMATESAISTAGSHPFSTGQDLCLVHNGSLSNHNGLRENLRRQGIQMWARTRHANWRAISVESTG